MMYFIEDSMSKNNMYINVINNYNYLTLLYYHDMVINYLLFNILYYCSILLKINIHYNINIF